MVNGMPFNQRWAMMNVRAMLNTLAFHGMLPCVNQGAPTSGASGTGAGELDKGTVLWDATNGIEYMQTGTLASPTWTKTGTQT